MSAFEVYLIMIADNIVAVFFVGALLSFVAFMFLGIMFSIMRSEDGPDDKNVIAVWGALKKAVIVLAITASGAMFIPGTKTIAAMYVVPAVASDERVQEIPDKLLDLANQKLDELVKEEQ